MGYTGYRFVQNDSQYYYLHGVDLSDERAVWDFLKENKEKYAIIKVTEKGEDVICVEAVNGRVVFPLQWSIMELSKEYEESPARFSPFGFIEELRIRGLEKQLIEVPFNVDQALEQLKRIYANLVQDPSSHS